MVVKRELTKNLHSHYTIKNNNMKKKDKEYVLDAIDSEGFDYAFVDYSDFDDIEDEEFHKLRKEYIEARNKLAKYVGVED